MTISRLLKAISSSRNCRRNILWQESPRCQIYPVSPAAKNSGGKITGKKICRLWKNNIVNIDVADIKLIHPYLSDIRVKFMRFYVFSVAFLLSSLEMGDQDGGVFKLVTTGHWVKWADKDSYLETIELL